MSFVERPPLSINPLHLFSRRLSPFQTVKINIIITTANYTITFRSNI